MWRVRQLGNVSLGLWNQSAWHIAECCILDHLICLLDMDKMMRQQVVCFMKRIHYDVKWDNVLSWSMWWNTEISMRDSPRCQGFGELILTTGPPTSPRFVWHGQCHLSFFFLNDNLHLIFCFLNPSFSVSLIVPPLFISPSHSSRAVI